MNTADVPTLDKYRGWSNTAGIMEQPRKTRYRFRGWSDTLQLWHIVQNSMDIADVPTLYTYCRRSRNELQAVSGELLLLVTAEPALLFFVARRV